MATKIKRTYTGKDVEMLTSCSTIVDHATEHKTFLVSKRANWIDPFFPDLKTRIDNAFTNILGVDNAQQMRTATQVVLGIEANALPALSEFKIQIMEDFTDKKVRRDEILTNLGFTAHLKAAQKSDQEALIQLLLSFKLNMTPAMQTEITNKGMAAATITTIISYAQVLKDSNITQETMKGSRKVITAAGVKEFNEIYKQVSSVAKISANFFKTDKAVQEKFSYAKTLKNLNRPPKITTPPSPLNPAS